ncbi:GntR family transcriptional regulator [Amycolatopsis rhizosphaerae]|uniref:GntR family transcriptional regulator n=1 Tax=Amycolatopsis rhizosphaerae TaxID=2053003 RepID=A0A558C0M5_9PSEU|nr:GntR family transcriptional regulator [Amycolatopsis rhizosphaerae]TVT42297.1 GntR family transcriptional regulator [Amycolatopsis rhizosphaerae]
MSTGDRSQAAAASERAYRWAKDRILDGRFEGGRLISEGEVADAMGLSRTPVREAFLRLSAESLLRLYPKRGALVVPVSAEEAADIAEARIFLERHAAAKVIGEGRQREVAKAMRGVLDEQRALTRPEQAPRFTALDRDFHATLVSAAGNALFDEFYGSLRDRQLRMVHTALRRDRTERPKLILEEHTRICELLEAGESEALHTLIATHITAVRDQFPGAPR